MSSDNQSEQDICVTDGCGRYAVDICKNCNGCDKFVCLHHRLIPCSDCKESKRRYMTEKAKYNREFPISSFLHSVPIVAIWFVFCSAAGLLASSYCVDPSLGDGLISAFVAVAISIPLIFLPGLCLTSPPLPPPKWNPSHYVLQQ
jgi:hypothetical protein